MNVAIFTDNDFGKVNGVTTTLRAVLEHEAQASGLPVVVSGAGGPSENMLPNRSGFVCGSDDPHEWAAAAVTILRTPGRRQAMGETGRRYSASRQWREALAPLYRAYQEVGVRRADAPTPLISLPRGA